MAGEFVVYRISPTDIAAMKRHFGATTTGVAHAAGPDGHGGVFTGWTPASSEVLNKVRRGDGELENRHALPPHFYVELPAGEMSEAQIKYLHGAPWVTNLQRPSAANFGSATLKPEARDAWALGKKVTALVEQAKTGPVSIEIYYVGSRQVSAAGLDAINRTVTLEQARMPALKG